MFVENRHHSWFLGIFKNLILFYLLIFEAKRYVEFLIYLNNCAVCTFIAFSRLVAFVRDRTTLLY